MSWPLSDLAQGRVIGLPFDDAKESEGWVGSSGKMSSMLSFAGKDIAY